MIPSDNDCHHPVAEVNTDVIKRATGDLGSWLGSVLFVDSSQVQVGFSIGPSYASNLHRRVRGSVGILKFEQHIVIANM